MSSKFAGKVVIVTGSSAGIGKATILHLAKAGASVTLHGQSKEKLAVVKNELLKLGLTDSRMCVVAGSLEDDETHNRLIEETVKHFGKLDILINNAATPGKVGIETNSIDGYDLIMKVNVRAIYRLCQLAAPHLEKTKGSIVNITSGLGERPFSMSMPYSISKAALNHLTRNFALLLAEKGIRVNSVSVGLTHTDLQSRAGVPKEIIDQMIADYSKKIPLGRTGDVDEQAEVIANIASPSNAYMTGSIVTVDGGGLLSM